MDLKRVDGLQNLLRTMNVAKHQYWSEHGVNSDNFPAAQDMPQRISSHVTHSQTNPTSPSQPRASERQVSTCIHPPNSFDIHHPPAQSSLEAKMVELSKMDSKSLMAAALAPATDFPNYRQQPNNGSSSRLVPGPNKQVEKSQAPDRAGKRRKRASSICSQTLSHEDTLAVSGNDASLRVTSASGPGTDLDPRSALKAPHKINCRSEVSHYEEVPHRPVITKQRQGTGKPAKRAPSHSISRQELSGIGINSNRHQRKPKSAYGDNKNPKDGDEAADNDTNADHQSRTTRQCAPGPRSVKKPRLTISSDPFNQSPPGTPLPPVGEEGDGDDDDDYSDRQPSRRKKQSHAKSATASSRSKRSASAKNRKYNFPVANTLSEASEADRMMFRMKGEGRSWKDITAEWSRLTGRQPGSSSLSVRYMKLKEKFSRMGDPDFIRLVRFKRTLEQQFETVEKWDRIADMIIADGGANYTGQALRRKFKNLVEGGLQTVSAAENLEAGGVEGCGGARGGGRGGSLGSLDELDRELMGDGEDDERRGEGTPSKSRARVGGHGGVDGDDVDVDVDDDHDFMDGELIGGD